MTEADRKYLPAEPIVAWTVFAILLTCYWLTVAPTVSFWDCPEYVSSAYLLEIGHPPGNPVWMLTERIVTLFVPPDYAALAVNLSSGLFTAFAAFFLAKTIFRVGLWVLLKLPHRRLPAPLAAAGAALTGALAFGFCDSVWYSAVEAEVYAMSIFMTSLCIWLMTKWAGTRSRGASWRLLVLIAYLFGLSIGIHQLNLLCIPALAMIWAVRRGIRTTGRLILIFTLSLIAVGCILVGMMPSSIALAAEFELLATNVFHLPALWGVGIYVSLMTLVLICALYTVGHCSNRWLMAAACFPAIFLSGIFIVSEHYAAGAIVSLVVAIALVCGSNFKVRRLYLAIWMLAMMLIGYSSYALIPVRGNIPSPANSSNPGEPFAFAAYQSREQYGAKPLLYGPTPFSRNLLKEEYRSDGSHFYSRYAIDYSSPIYAPRVENGKLRSHIPGISKADSARNAEILKRDGAGYIVKGMKATPRKIPELNIWFPRITSSKTSHITSYGEWVGMDTSSMVKVAVSEVLDSASNPQGKLGKDGKRRLGISYRPTYLQNISWLLTYQTGYMYWRYLLWNFVGRQNDRPSQGEVQHGNFITGIPVVDNAMLGAEDSLPPVAGCDNPGRNRYFGLPFILGILGILWLLKSRRRGKQACAITAILFIMTGLAITVYLNQDPGEPRERDYSFLGSYLAFSIWIGFGALLIARRLRSLWGFAISLAVVAWMGVENYDDHDRSNRYAARYFARNMLESLEKNGILFVNGDNYTFPLWYAQEVEGVRRDVRIINLAYLQTPVYAANQMKDWREAPAVQTTLTRGDIIWDAFKRVNIDNFATDTVSAIDALAELRDMEIPKFRHRFVTIPLNRDSVMVYDLRKLNTDGRGIEFRNLIMFDMVATNSSAASPRPIYWLGALGADKRIGMTEGMSPWLFGYRFGIDDADRTDSLLCSAILKILPVNPPGKPVYMDRAPSMMTGALRGPLISAGTRLLRNGNITGALEAARRSDVLMGNAPDSFVPMIIEDTLFRVRKELGNFLLECADTLLSRSLDPTLTASEKEKLNARGIELKSRGKYHLKAYYDNREAWNEYRRCLPARLRPKMAPVY